MYNTTVLYILQGFMYALNGYFALAGTNWFAHQMKALQNRFDFSIDIFSPLLKIDKHIKRRIWQETLSTILLCGTSFQMPQDQIVAFSISDTDKWPPYLLWFEGTVAERHVENLKILKAIGMSEYKHAVNYSRSHVSHRLAAAIQTIQQRFTGPDAYWRPMQPPFPQGVSSWFGKAFLVPFPPTLVIRYDQGSSSTIQLDTLHELETFVQQNSSEDVESKRMVRRALRALEGQDIFCPYNHMAFLGADDTPGLLHHTSERRYLSKPTAYAHGVLAISRRRVAEFAGYNYGSGFAVKIVFEDGRQQDPAGVVRVRKRVEVHASAAFGLHDDFELTPQLAQFLRDNEHIIRQRLPAIDDLLQNYRNHFYWEAKQKECVMPYSFLTDVFDRSHLTSGELIVALRNSHSCKDIRRLSSDYQASITILYERMRSVDRSLVHRWWWLFWDELWRKNSPDFKQLRTHRRAFSPHYPTSIAYRPMPRAQLEKFLQGRGLWVNGGAKGLFNRGLLNRIYFQLDQLVFASDGSAGSRIHPSPNAIPIGIGNNANDVQVTPYQTLRDRDLAAEQAQENDGRALLARRLGEEDGDEYLINQNDDGGPSSRLTGGGTDYSSESIIIRPAYTWEQRMFFLKPSLSRWTRSKNRILEFLSLHPFIVDSDAKALFLYLAVEGGRYVLPPKEWRPSSRSSASTAMKMDGKESLDKTVSSQVPLLLNAAGLGYAPAGRTTSRARDSFNESHLRHETIPMQEH